MPDLATRRFGAIHIDDRDVIQFPGGLPGFESHTRFTLIAPPSASPLLFLQSLDSPELCFLTTPVDAVDPEYQLELTPADRHEFVMSNDLIALAIVTAPEQGPATANLLAPIVIDSRQRIGIQAVRMDTRYSHQHALPEAGLRCS
jgi:flagellar assembly factor FliW